MKQKIIYALQHLSMCSWLKRLLVVSSPSTATSHHLLLVFNMTAACNPINSFCSKHCVRFGVLVELMFECSAWTMLYLCVYSLLIQLPRGLSDNSFVEQMLIMQKWYISMWIYHPTVRLGVDIYVLIIIVG